jgi:two-component system OmpR family response regulator
MAPSILVVDDEPHIREVIGFALTHAGMAITLARNGAEAMMAFGRGGHDLIVLDIGMPELDGLEVCRRVRQTSDLPILFLSARDDEIDRVLGLELGGDDYVTKPCSPRELVARVRAILKRSGGGGPERRRPALREGAITLDRTSHTVAVGVANVPLTAIEFTILEALMARPSMVFDRTRLMTAAYGPSIFVADRTIDSHIRNIRAKFAAAGLPAIIATVHGVGFRFSAGEP